MPYIPPKYPGQIPTVEDLPNRADDVDWMYAARYNELKKELRAALIELGTDPAGTFATVKARLDALLPHFHDRGDPATRDFITGNFTTDGNWHDLDLSSIVPAGAKAVVLTVLILDNAVSSYLTFREKGNTNTINQVTIFTQVANIEFWSDVIVAIDGNRKIEYRGKNLAFTAIYVVVKGWWK